ncbi:uncharacterized protein LOC124165067 isoform X1 [Ischnura elegans]|uniref:uncharacterized protein LOC124165067 isoform X1 n=1 Tax=Ischnura elegans TaxID=197161 RepID=UPI001ED8A661|nr:uncharacterized protein LOC124165067 isoform X1 [Ischnura elegans]
MVWKPRATRGVKGLWRSRGLGAAGRVPSHKVQQLFNDMDLFPSKSQVYEMLQCAKECAQRSSASYLTFGEFCLFASELKRCYDGGVSRPLQMSRLPPEKRAEKMDGKGSGRRWSKRGLVSSFSSKPTVPNAGVVVSSHGGSPFDSAGSKSTEMGGSETDGQGIHSEPLPVKCEVFLGGSCNPTTWRQDIAIPALNALGISYYNPQVSQWGPELIEQEHTAKQTASLLFFVIDSQTRSVASMLEVAHISGRQRKLVLVVLPYQGPGQLVCGEPISQREFEDLSSGQAVMQDLVERQGIPVFDSIPVALDCAAKVLRENIGVQDLGLKDNAQPVKMGHVQLGDKLLKLRETFDDLDTGKTGKLSLMEVCLAFQSLSGRTLHPDELLIVASGILGRESEAADGSIENNHHCMDGEPKQPKRRQQLVPRMLCVNLTNESALRVNFEQFCAIVAEFKARGHLDCIAQSSDSKANSDREKRTEEMKPSKDTEEHSEGTTLNSTERAVDSQHHILELGGNGQTLSTTLARNDGELSRQIDVYLGGSCGDSRWREDIAIPILKQRGLAWFDPQSVAWAGQRLSPLEAAAMEKCLCLLFVITCNTRAVAAMTMAAHYVGLECEVVLCVQRLPEDCVIGNDRLSAQAIKDYNRARMYLLDLASREGIPVFAEISEAVECAASKCQSLQLR